MWTLAGYHAGVPQSDAAHRCVPNESGTDNTHKWRRPDGVWPFRAFGRNAWSTWHVVRVVGALRQLCARCLQRRWRPNGSAPARRHTCPSADHRWYVAADLAILRSERLWMISKKFANLEIISSTKASTQKKWCGLFPYAPPYPDVFLIIFTKASNLTLLTNFTYEYALN